MPAARSERGGGRGVADLAVPIRWSFSTSLGPPLDSILVAGLGLPGIDLTPTLATHREELAQPGATRALRNSAVVSIGSTVLAFVLGVPAGPATARSRWPSSAGGCGRRSRSRSRSGR